MKLYKAGTLQIKKQYYTEDEEQFLQVLASILWGIALGLFTWTAILRLILEP